MRRTAVFAFLLNLASLAAAQDSIRWKTSLTGTDQQQQVKRHNLLRSHAALEFRKPPSSEDFVQLRDRGVTVLSVLSDRAFVVSVPEPFSTAGLNLAWTGRFNSKDKIGILDGSRPRPGRQGYFLAEFYPDVDRNDARSMAIASGLRVVDNPDLLDHDLLVEGTPLEISALAEWDEIEYVFPAAAELIAGIPVNACAGAMTSQGPVSHGVPFIGEGWDGPGRNSAALNYAFASLTSKLPADTAKAEIVRAMSEWAKYAKLTFTLTNNPTTPRTLAVLFAHGAHGDAYPFDGQGGMLAHTFYPYPSNPESIAGDLHFDADENWRIGLDPDLFSLSLHELGHALGLGHSDNPDDVMYPYYRRVTALAKGDIAAIQGLYAAQDTAAPAAPVVPLAITVQGRPTVVTSASITLSGTVTGGTSDVQVTWRNGGASGVAQGTRTWSASIPLSPGSNTILLDARDVQQNSANATVTVTRQPTAPAAAAIQIAQPAASGSYSTVTGTVTLSGTAMDPGGIDHVSWTNSRGGSGSATGAANWSAGPIPLQPGQNVLTVTAYGKTGGAATATIVVNYTPLAPRADTTAPSITITAPAGTNISTSTAMIVFCGTASDNVGLTSVTWTNSTGGFGAATGTTSWKTPSIPLLVGTNTITIRAYDAAGNAGWRSVIVTRTP